MVLLLLASLAQLLVLIAHQILRLLVLLVILSSISDHYHPHLLEAAFAILDITIVEHLFVLLALLNVLLALVLQPIVQVAT